MNDTLRKIKWLALAAVLALSVACSGDSDDRVEDDMILTCAEGEVLCPDETCAPSPAECPMPTVEPEPLTGSVTSIQPLTVPSSTPGGVRLEIEVDDLERASELIENGATAQVEVRSGERPELIEAIAETTDSFVIIEFDPVSVPGAGISDVAATLSDGENTYELGSAALRFHEDAKRLQFENHDAFSLDGLVEPTRTWSPDLDGDGLSDLVVLDASDDRQGTVFRVFQCEADRCESAGATSISDDMIIAPDMIVAPDTTPGQGFLAMVEATRADDGRLTSVEVLRMQLDGGNIATTRATIGLESTGILHEATVRPVVLVEPDTMEERLAAVATETLDPGGRPVWSTSVFDETGTVTKHQPAFKFAAPDEASAALAGELGACTAPGKSTLRIGDAPEGLYVATYSLGDTNKVAIGSGDPATDQGSIFEITGWDADTYGDFGLARCSNGDLDGDGYGDVAVAIGGKENFDRSKPHARLFLGKRVDGAAGVETQQLVDTVGDIHSKLWTASGDGGAIYLGIYEPDTQQGESPLYTGAELVACPECGDGEFDGFDPTLTDSYSHRGLAVVDPNELSSEIMLADGHDGNDLLVRKKPGGRSPEVSSGSGGALDSSEELILAEGSWMLTGFSSGIQAGQETRLEQTEPEEILGWLSTTGPFIPLDPGTEGTMGALAWNADGSARYFSLSEPDATTGLPTGKRRHSLSMVDGTPTLGESEEIEFDYTAVSAEGNVVKFRAGAELSKSANPGSGDCDDDDTCVRPGLFAMQLDTGDVLIGELDEDDDGDGIATVEETDLSSELSTLLNVDSIEAARATLWVGDLGDGPVVTLRAFIDGRSAIVWQSADGQVESLAGEGILHLADIDGSGSKDTVLCHNGSCRINGAEPVALDVSSTVAMVRDLNGDGCADVITEAQDFASGSCNGSFENAAQLGDWIFHLTAPLEATSHNASRSNRSQGGFMPPDEDFSTGALPFVDGLYSAPY